MTRPVPTSAEPSTAGAANIPIDQTGNAQQSAAREQLRGVIDPELGVNIVDLGLVYGLDVDDGQVRVSMTMTSPGCPLGRYLEEAIDVALRHLRWVRDVHVDVVWDPPWQPGLMSPLARTQLGWSR